MGRGHTHPQGPSAPELKAETAFRPAMLPPGEAKRLLPVEKSPSLGPLMLEPLRKICLCLQLKEEDPMSLK